MLGKGITEKEGLIERDKIWRKRRREKNEHPVRRPSGVLGAYHVAYRMVVAPDGRFLHPKNDHPVRRPSGKLQSSHEGL